MKSNNKDLKEFVVRGNILKDAGWLQVYTWSRHQDQELPNVSEGEKLDLKDILFEAKQTQPPGRYTEAGLIKELEKRGIGRPSTYASIISTIINRGYVTKDGKTLFPTDTGDVVSSFLEEHFTKYISDDFTASLEDQLDHIAHNEAEYRQVLGGFYDEFTDAIHKKEDIEKLTNLGKADSKFKCPVCGAGMLIKLGKGGKFLSCERYPDCDGALALDGSNLTEGEEITTDAETGLPVLLMSGRYGHYLQLGHENKETKEKPHRVSLPPKVTPKNLTPEIAQQLIKLPITLGEHPDDGEPVIVNIGRFGPYVGHLKNYRSLKKGDDPYTITFERAVELLKEPKRLPKGVELHRKIGTHPKTGKEINLLKSKSGFYLPKGLKRIYLDDSMDPDKITVEEVVAFLKGANPKKKK